MAEQFTRKAKSVKKDETPGTDMDGNEHFVSSGSTLLNLALSDRPDGGWLTGHMVHIVGDSNTGKSLEAMTILAEAAHDKWFDDFLLEDNDRESSREFDVTKLFGNKTANKIVRAPYLETIEDWQLHLHKMLNAGKPFIHVLDSFDALTSKGEMAVVESQLGEGKAKGSMGAEKAKVNSATFRQLVGKLEQSKSLVVIVSQTRDKINTASFAAAAGNHFSGGNALKFYGHQRIFLAVKETKKSKGIPIGSTVVVKVDRTRITGKKRTVEFPIYYDYGIDDIGSMIDFLTIQSKEDDGFWEKKKNTIIAEDFEIEATRDKLVRQIEQSDEMIAKLKELTTELWNEIEESVKLNRRGKYSD